MAGIFFEIGIFISVASVLGYLFFLGRQPPIPAYIIGGGLLGLLFTHLGVPVESDVIMTLSEIGIAFLLFGVGLEMDFAKLKSVGKVATVGGLLQMVVLFAVGTTTAALFAFTRIEAVYLGLFLAFSSTMVVVKILSDQGELDTVHGRIMVAILLFQDIVALIALAILQDLGHFAALQVLISVGSVALIILVGLFLSRFFFPTIFRSAARSHEILFLLAISVCFLFALLFNQLGFSIVIGAFVAGLTLGNLPYKLEIAGRIRPLRDFFGTLFFATIGFVLSSSLSALSWGRLAILLLIVLLVVPAVYLLVCSTFGYKRHTAFLVATGMAQSSEFGLVLALQGLALGHIGGELFSLIILVAIVTMSWTVYFMKYGDHMYRSLSPALRAFDRIGPPEIAIGALPKAGSYNAILVGHDRIGYAISKTLTDLGYTYIVVDFNPDVVRGLAAKGVPCVYGDIGNPEFLAHLDLRAVRLVIATIPDQEATKYLISCVKLANPRAEVFVTSYRVADALALYEAGADYVIIPHYLGGEHMALLLHEASGNLDRMIALRLQHIKELKERKERHPHHQ